MKRIIITVLFILLLISPAHAQNGLISDSQLSPVTISATAGEDLTVGKVVSIINENGTTKAYMNPLTVNTSPNGAESVFNAATTTYCSAVALDSTRFLVAYKGTSNYGYSIVGTVSGSSISWGTQSSSFENVTANYISACKIASNKVLVIYSDASNVKTRCVVLTISTATITVNSPVDVDANNCKFTSVTCIDDDKAVATYQDIESSSKGYAAFISVSETIPTAQTPILFNNGTTEYISCSALDATHVICVYQDASNSSYGTAQVLSISGTTITPGTEYLPYGNKAFAYNSITTINSTSAILVFADSAIDAYGRAAHITNNSGALTFGDILAPKTDNNNGRMSIAKIDNTHFLWTLADYTGTENGYNCILTLTGTTLSASDYYNFNASATPNYISSCYLGSQKSVIAYQDHSNSDHGTAVVNTWATLRYDAIPGTALSTVTSGNTAKIIVDGIDSNQTSLIPFSPYYLQADFSIGTTPIAIIGTYSGSDTREIYIGTAKSTTELFINPDYR